MRVALHSTTKKIAVLATAIVLASIYAGVVTAEFVAVELYNRDSLPALELAAKLQPWDGEYQDQLGRYLLSSKDATAAVNSFRRAVELDRNRAIYWLDLANAYNISERPAEQQRAIEEALSADPKTPSTAWIAGNLYMSRGENDRAMTQFRVVLEGDPSMSLPVLSQCERISNVDTILAKVMPPNPAVYSTLLDMLVAQKRPTEAVKVWGQMVQLNQPIEKNWVIAYVNYLLAEHEVDNAVVAWRQAANLANLSAYQPSSANLAINGDFSLRVLNGGLDWRYEQSHDVTLALDPTQSHSGSRSLSMTFNGSGIADAGIRQLIPVEADSAYEISAYYKAEKLEGAGGPRFAVEDADSGTMLYASDEIKNADVWRAVDGTFATGAATRLIAIRVQRFPTGKAMRGTLWIDGVRLVRKDESNVH